MKRPIDILVFGGSFDPIHEGHIHMLKTAIATCEPEHTVVVPNYLSPLKSKTLFTNIQRLTMTKKVVDDAFSSLSIEVSDIEVESEGKSYTVRTLETLTEQFKGKRIGFLCGSDSVLSLQKWVEPRRILELATCVVMLREKDSQEDVEDYFNAKFESSNYIILDGTIHESSSTAIRSEIIGKNDVLNHVPRGIESLVKEYMNDYWSDR